MGTDSQVVVFDSSGNFLRKWGSRGSSDSQFYLIRGIAIAGNGNVYTAEWNNSRVQAFDSTGTFLNSWHLAAQPGGIAVNNISNVYVTAFSRDDVVRVFDSSGAFLFEFGCTGSGDGQLNHPSGIAIDGNGDVYVVDGTNYRIEVFDSAGSYLRQWGSQGSGDGQFISLTDIQADKFGNLYVLDLGNRNVQVFDNTKTFKTKWGSLGGGDGQLMSPFGIAVDKWGYVYVTDSGRHGVSIFEGCLDRDLDGYDYTVDCNDKDGTIYPGASEIKHDGIDQDCNGYDLTIDIVSAQYNASSDKLDVEATSDYGASANLELVGYGPMTWDSNHSRWSFYLKQAGGDPGTVMVSGPEGQESVVVPYP